RLSPATSPRAPQVARCAAHHALPRRARLRSRRHTPPDLSPPPARRLSQRARVARCAPPLPLRLPTARLPRPPPGRRRTHSHCRPMSSALTTDWKSRVSQLSVVGCPLFSLRELHAEDEPSN